MKSTRTSSSPDLLPNVQNFGTAGTPNTQISISNGTFTFGDLSITTTNGTTANSGIFGGNIPTPGVNQEASVFGNADTNRGYLAAGGGTLTNPGIVDITRTDGQVNTLAMLWGTVDRGTLRNVIHTNGGDTITGEDVWTAMDAAGRANGDGNTNVWLIISGLNNFNEATFKDFDANSFEFTVRAGLVAPVPEASTWAMMLIGFLGVGLSVCAAGSVRVRSGCSRPDE